jgi:hypothetical protein
VKNFLAVCGIIGIGFAGFMLGVKGADTLYEDDYNEAYDDGYDRGYEYAYGGEQYDEAYDEGYDNGWNSAESWFSNRQTSLDNTLAQNP